MTIQPNNSLQATYIYLGNDEPYWLPSNKPQSIHICVLIMNVKKKRPWKSKQIKYLLCHQIISPSPKSIKIFFLDYNLVSLLACLQFLMKKHIQSTSIMLCGITYDELIFLFDLKKGSD